MLFKGGQFGGYRVFERKKEKKKNLIQLVLDPPESNHINPGHISLLARVAGAEP